MSHSRWRQSVIYISLILFCAGQGFGETALEQAVSEGISTSIVSLPKAVDVQRIAILPLRGDETGEITDRLISAIVEKGMYKVIDRGQLEILFKEADFQMTEIVDSNTAVRAGKIAGVDAVMYGVVKRQRSGDDWADLSFHVQIAKVETGEIFWADDVEKTVGTPPRPIANIDPVWLYAIGIILIVFIASVILWTRHPKPSVTTAGRVEVIREKSSVDAKNAESQTISVEPGVKVIGRKNTSNGVKVDDTSSKSTSPPRTVKAPPESRVKQATSSPPADNGSPKIAVTLGVDVVHRDSAKHREPPVKVTGRNDSPKKVNTATDVNKKHQPAMEGKNVGNKTEPENRSRKITVKPGVRVVRPEDSTSQAPSVAGQGKKKRSKPATPSPVVKVQSEGTAPVKGTEKSNSPSSRSGKISVTPGVNVVRHDETTPHEASVNRTPDDEENPPKKVIPTSDVKVRKN